MRVSGLYLLSFLFGSIACHAQSARRSLPWDTCSLVEGKGDLCGPGQRPRPFAEFLQPGKWATEPNDGFAYEFGWDLRYIAADKPLHVTWQEIGRLGPRRIRSVLYTLGEDPFAEILLAEGSAGIFAPLMKWSGNMPSAVILQATAVPVLVLEKNFGGNVPMVSTWAWVSGPSCPVRLDVHGATNNAIQKVAPNYAGYDMALDWKTMHWRTAVWPQDNYPGKVGVHEGLEAWFEIAGTDLIIKRVEYSGDGGTKRWP